MDPLYMSIGIAYIATRKSFRQSTLGRGSTDLSTLSKSVHGDVTRLFFQILKPDNQPLFNDHSQ